MAVSIIAFILTTAFESAGLVLWLRDYLGGHPYQGYLLLITGELLELVVFVSFLHRGQIGPRDRSPVRVVGAMVVISVFESLLWLAWIAVAQRYGLPAAAIVLFVLMHIKHDIDVATVSDTPPFRQVFTLNGIIATSLEVVGGMLLFALAREGRWVLGAFAFAACNTIEHLVGGLIVARALGGRGYLTSSKAGAVA